MDCPHPTIPPETQMPLGQSLGQVQDLEEPYVDPFRVPDLDDPYEHEKLNKAYPCNQMTSSHNRGIIHLNRD